MTPLQSSHNIYLKSLKKDFSHSFWLEYMPENPAEEPLRGTNRCDVAIIGGGFTGLSAAYHTRKLLPGADVRVLEANKCGFGSSGLNAGFSSTLFGMGKALTESKYGKKQAIAAHHYMEDAVDYVNQIVCEHALECDYEQSGSLMVATTQAQVQRVENELRITDRWDLKGFEAWDEARLSDEFQTQLYRHGLFQSRSAMLNPADLAHGLKRIAKEAGAIIHEMSPVASVEEESAGFRIRTPNGELQADRLVFATNAYSILFPRLAAKQTPIFQHIVVSEPLTDAQLESIGWKSRCGLSDARSLMHYYRLTADNRILIGGGNISPVRGRHLNYDGNKKVFAHLEQHVIDIYPQLKGLTFTHRWSGLVSITADLTPVIGFLDSKKRAVFSLGLMGHGVSMAPYNGFCLAELLAGQKSKRTEMFFVGRRTMGWMPNVLRFPIVHGVRALLKLEDRFRWAKGP